MSRKKRLDIEQYKIVKELLKRNTVKETVEKTGMSMATVSRINKTKNFKDYKNLISSYNKQTENTEVKWYNKILNIFARSN